MSDAFDPYLRWLGIRDPQRPPNHYRLLGLDLFENDSDVIAVAADRQMAHVRTFQTGQLAELSQQLLNELSAVRICLLKPEKKAAYDAQLKKQLGGAAVAARPKPQSAPGSSASRSATGLPVAERITEETSPRAPSAGSGDAAMEEFPDFGSLASATGFDPSLATGKSATGKSFARNSAARSRRKKSLGPWIGLAAAGILLVIGVVVVQSMNEQAPPVAMADGAKHTAPEAASNKAPAPVKAGSKEQGAGSRERGAGSKEPGTSSIDRGNVAVPSSGGAVAPDSQSSPPEPPVRSPRDVALVDNPPQHESSENAQPPDKSGSDKSSDPDKTNPAAPKKNAPNKSAPIKTTASKPIVEVPDKPKLPAVPDKEALAAAEKTIQSIYKSDLDQANHGGPEAKAALAKQWMARGMETTDNPAARYVLLTKARDLAVAGGDVRTASSVVKKLGESYSVAGIDEQLLTCFAGLGKTVRTREAAEALRHAAEKSADEAIAVDNYDLAGKFTRLAAGTANKLRDQFEVAQLKAKLTEIELCKKEYAKLADTLDRLKTDQDDAEASLAAGRFFAFTKGDFDRALPYLAKSSDAELKGLASKDLAAPIDPTEQAKLGDAWWSVAEANHEPAKSLLQFHAASWYSKAAPKLKGLAKDQVESRLKEIEATSRPLATANTAQLRKMLTENVWNIHFFGNPAARREPDFSGFDYPRYHFFENGTVKAENEAATGHWILDGDTVTVRFDEISPGDGWAKLVHTYQIVGDSLRGEQYRIPDVQLINKGVGTKVPQN